MGQLSAKRAIELYREALAEAAKGFGDHHPALGKAYLDLAVARYRAADLEGAVGEWQAAGRLYDEAYGRGQPDGRRLPPARRHARRDARRRR
jgi:hypothetical protein